MRNINGGRRRTAPPLDLRRDALGQEPLYDPMKEKKRAEEAPMTARIRKPKVKSTKRSRVMLDVLRREDRGAASRPALSRFARSAAKRRGPASLRRAAPG